MKYLFTLFFLSGLTIAFAQHEPIYSQYMFNGLVINPAYSGNNNALTGIIHYRKQWSGFRNGAPETQTLSLYTPLRNKHLNVGLLFAHDVFGLSKNTDGSGIFAYRMELGKGNIAIGIQAGFVSLSNNWSEIRTEEEETSEIFNPAVKNEWIPKLGIGTYYNHKNYFVGLSMPQGFTSDISGKNLFFNAGYNLYISKSIILKPSILTRYIKNSPAQADLNVIISFKDALSLGTSYRKDDSFVFLMEYRKQQFSIGYAYDYLLNNLRNEVSGSHEFMVKYQFQYKLNVMNPRDFH